MWRTTTHPVVCYCTHRVSPHALKSQAGEHSSNTVETPKEICRHTLVHLCPQFWFRSLGFSAASVVVLVFTLGTCVLSSLLQSRRWKDIGRERRRFIPAGKGTSRKCRRSTEECCVWPVFPSKTWGSFTKLRPSTLRSSDAYYLDDVETHSKQ